MLYLIFRIGDVTHWPDASNTKRLTEGHAAAESELRGHKVDFLPLADPFACLYFSSSTLGWLDANRSEKDIAPSTAVFLGVPAASHRVGVTQAQNQTPSMIENYRTRLRRWHRCSIARRITGDTDFSHRIGATTGDIANEFCPSKS